MNFPVVHAADDGWLRGCDLSHASRERALAQVRWLHGIAKEDAVANDVAVLPLAPGQLVGRRDAGHGDQGFEQQAHAVVHGMGYFDLQQTI